MLLEEFACSRMEELYILSCSPLKHAQNQHARVIDIPKYPIPRVTNLLLQSIKRPILIRDYICIHALTLGSLMQTKGEFQSLDHEPKRILISKIPFIALISINYQADGLEHEPKWESTAWLICHGWLQGDISRKSWLQHSVSTYRSTCLSLDLKI